MHQYVSIADVYAREILDSRLLSSGTAENAMAD